MEGLQGAHQLLDVANEKDTLRPGAPLGFDDEWKGDVMARVIEFAAARARNAVAPPELRKA